MLAGLAFQHSPSRPDLNALRARVAMLRPYDARRETTAVFAQRVEQFCAIEGRGPIVPLSADFAVDPAWFQRGGSDEQFFCAFEAYRQSGLRVGFIGSESGVSR